MSAATGNRFLGRLCVGPASGLMFARKERDVAVPTPVAAGLAAFLFALGVPFVVFVVIVVLGMAISHTGQ
jgi:uncharacterized protein (DUF2062 family)